MVTQDSLSLTRINPQGVSYEKNYGHIYYLEENLLHAIFKLYVWFQVVTEGSSYTLIKATTPYLKFRLQRIEYNKKL